MVTPVTTMVSAVAIQLRPSWRRDDPPRPASTAAEVITRHRAHPVWVCAGTTHVLAGNLGRAADVAAAGEAAGQGRPPPRHRSDSHSPSSSRRAADGRRVVDIDGLIQARAGFPSAVPTRPRDGECSTIRACRHIVGRRLGPMTLAGMAPGRDRGWGGIMRGRSHRTAAEGAHSCCRRHDGGDPGGCRRGLQALHLDPSRPGQVQATR